MTGTTAYERLVDVFRAEGLTVIERCHGHASAQAPGHSPADRSIDIRDIGGQVLINSHSDPTDMVLDALRVRYADLFDNPRGVEYHYPDGRIVHRTPDKKFRQAGNTKGRSLYHADRLNGAELVYVAEGEKDVHALESAGVVATCTAMGAGKAHLFDLAPLHGKAVRIIADRDKPGMAHANQVAELLAGKADVSIWEPASGKDAADHIAAGRTIDEFVAVQTAPPHGITAVLRTLLDAAETTPADELIQRAYAELDALAAPADEETAIRKFDTITDEWWAWIDAPQADIRTIATPWPGLNDLLAGGLHPGRSYLIACRPGGGKSLALTNIAAHAAEAGRKGLLFSLEMGRIEIASRIIAAGAGAEYSQITRRTIDAHNLAGIAEYLDRARDMPLWVCDRASVTVYQIRDAARRMSRGDGVDFVGVDYAQLLRPADTRETRERQIADISRNLKILAKDLNVAVVTACQLNRAPAKEKRPPTIAELRESGALEQDSDVVILLHHNTIDDMPTGEVDVIVGKNRTGKLATVTLPWRAYRASIG